MRSTVHRQARSASRHTRKSRRRRSGDVGRLAIWMGEEVQMIRYMCLTLAILLVGSVGCSGRSSPPAPILFAPARSSDCRRAPASLQALNEAVSNLPTDLRDPDIAAQLQSRLA